ncbi:hypothetical protein DKL61_13125 [Gammaproteobacteria bacterium ESL0073]|nr:hypothetical protein DKL61_13125 [Gammaproteobacteria bacterium ESL0073]
MISLTITLLSFLAVYLGWLCFVSIILCSYFIKKKYYRKTSYFVLMLSFLFLWAHYIEPNIILTQDKTIKGLGFNADVILISDIHLGLYKNEDYLQRVVDKINNISADYVVIAGDFTYKANVKDYKKYFKPLAHINKPVYAVRGNHDYRISNKELLNVLKQYRVNLIENQIINLGTYQLAGLSDRLESHDDTSFLNKANKTKPILVLTHNPDSSDRLLPFNVPLLLAGHTHCGQVYLPFITNRLVIRTQHKFTCGYYEATDKTVPVFITPGIGEDNLPLRLFTPPTINILHLQK